MPGAGKSTIVNKLEELGFEKVKCREGTRTFKGSSYHTWDIAHQGIIGCLFNF